MPLQGWEFVILLLVLILLFGAKRLPDTAKALGQSLKIFKKSVRDEDGDKATQESSPPREITSASDEVVEPTRVEQPDRTER